MNTYTLLSSSINIFFQNARSIKSVNKDFNELRSLKNFLTSETPDILCVVETWLDSNALDLELHVDGYQFFRRDRGSRGGGIIVYFRSDLICTHRKDLVAHFPNFNEIMVCEISAHLEKFFLVNFYRPPNADQTFNDNLSDILSKINNDCLYFKSTILPMCMKTCQSHSK